MCAAISSNSLEKKKEEDEFSNKIICMVDLFKHQPLVLVEEVPPTIEVKPSLNPWIFSTYDKPICRSQVIALVSDLCSILKMIDI